MWGRSVQVVDGHRRYVRPPVAANRPLSMWSNRWSTMPIHAYPQLRLPRPDGRAVLDRMPGSDVPVIRQPFAPGDPVPFWAVAARRAAATCCTTSTTTRTRPTTCAGSAAEGDMAELLRHALVELEAPADQLERLALAR